MCIAHFLAEERARNMNLQHESQEASHCLQAGFCHRVLSKQRVFVFWNKALVEASSWVQLHSSSDLHIQKEINIMPFFFRVFFESYEFAVGKTDRRQATHLDLACCELSSPSCSPPCSAACTTVRGSAQGTGTRLAAFTQGWPALWDHGVMRAHKRGPAAEHPSAEDSALQLFLRLSYSIGCLALQSNQGQVPWDAHERQRLH